MRPCEDTRERALAELRRGYVSGRIGTDVPPVIDRMIADGALGRKTKRGFYVYD